MKKVLSSGLLLLIANNSFAMNHFFYNPGGGGPSGFGQAPSAQQQEAAIAQRMNAEAQAKAAREKKDAENRAAAEQAQVASVIQDMFTELAKALAPLVTPSAPTPPQAAPEPPQPEPAVPPQAAEPAPAQPPQEDVAPSHTVPAEPTREPCFPGETLITVVDPDTKITHQARIDSIKIGDSVVSCNLSLNGGTCEIGQVVALNERSAKELIRFTFSGEFQSFRATLNHPIYSVDKKDYQHADSFRPGEHVLGMDGNPVEIKDIARDNENTSVYNLEIRGQNNYYACGILVHNCNVTPVVLAASVAPLFVPGVGEVAFGLGATVFMGQQVYDHLTHQNTGANNYAPLDPQTLETTITPNLPQNTSVQTPIQDVLGNTAVHTPATPVEQSRGTQTPIDDVLGNTSVHIPIVTQDPIDTITERIPQTDGSWVGAPGNSDWTSTNPEVNRITQGTPVPFKDNYPDFSRWIQKSYEFGDLNGKNSHDFALGDRRFAEEMRLPSQKAAKEYRGKNRLTWHHHQDGRTLELVPTDLHKNVPHDGGASELRGN